MQVPAKQGTIAPLNLRLLRCDPFGIERLLPPTSASHRLELDITRLFGSRHQFAISPGVEVPLSRQNLEYKLILDVAWYF